MSVALVALLAAGLTVLAPWPIRVVDGDTIDRGLFRHRLAGFDAPEIRRARCQAEREAGLAAKVRLESLIAGAATVELVRVPRRADPYGRVVSRLLLDGRDVADVAIAEGWARPYDGRRKAAGWCGE